MRIVYEAANSVEGHMLVNYLSMFEINAFLQGEHLQSGVGQLPASGLMTIYVDDKDWQKARQIIEAWEAEESDDTNTKPIASNLHHLSLLPILTLVIGAMFGTWAMHYYTQSPVTHDGVDFNGDEILDERFTYNNGWLSLVEKDRNFDGSVDAKHHYEKGLNTTSLSDEDFDGHFDTEYFFQNNETYFMKSDTNGDGQIDLVIDYFPEHDYYLASHFDSKTKHKRKVQRIQHNKLISAEWDSDNDGILDTLIKYNELEEEISREKIIQPRG